MINNIQFPRLGLEFSVNRVAFSIFGLDIYWYGLILTGGMLAAVLVAFYLAKKLDIDTDKMLDVIMVGGIMGVICARAYYVAFAPFEYHSLWDMINIRDGGLGIYGGVIGAFVFGGLACRWRKLDFLNMADITGVCLLLGQGIGRWGNFVNQEAFGTNTDGLFGMISEGTTAYLQRTAPYLASQGIIVDPYSPVHPTFLYESVWCLIGFAALMLYFNKRKFKGELISMYAVWYGIGRFVIEGLRTDSLEIIPGLRTSQVVALVSVAVGAAVLIYNYIKLKKADGKDVVNG